MTARRRRQTRRSTATTLPDGRVAAGGGLAGRVVGEEPDVAVLALEALDGGLGAGLAFVAAVRSAASDEPGRGFS